MQDFIEFLKKHNELKVIDEPLDIELEIPHLAYLEVKKKDSKALLFTRPICRSLDSKPTNSPTLAGGARGGVITTQNNKEDSKNMESKNADSNNNLSPTHHPISKNIESKNLDSKHNLDSIKQNIESNLTQNSHLHHLHKSIPTHPPTCKINANGTSANFDNTQEKSSYKDSKNIESKNADSNNLENLDSKQNIDSKNQTPDCHHKNIESKEYEIPVLMNVFGSFRRLELIANHYNSKRKFKDIESIAAAIKSLLNPSVPKGFKGKIKKLMEIFEARHIFPKPYKVGLKNAFIGKFEATPPAQEIIIKGDSINLFDLPILKTWEEDGGRFITMGQVFTRNYAKDSNNVGMYRLQVKSKNELLMHWQIHKDATHFFHEYKRHGKKMPVSIAIGGDPLYIWCAQAPMPPKMFELMLYGLIRGKNPRLVKCITNDLAVPPDSDIVIEGYVDTNHFAPEGKFGDHTGFYTPIEPYPVLKVTAITMKKKPIYLATVVGKPPLEDKYFGYMTERVFLPLLQTSVHGLLDYSMPENGVFHNLILARIRHDYPAESLQIMHAFFGLGQLSFVKHAIFLGVDAPSIHDNYKILTDYILDRICVKNLYITQGICDALDHAAEKYAVSGKLGIDACGAALEFDFMQIDSKDLLAKMQEIASEIQDVRIYKHKNPIVIAKVCKKDKPILHYAREFANALKNYAQFFIFIDSNELHNDYMLIWRIVNSIDVSRDLKIIESKVAFLDATSKGALENYDREYPKDVLCTKEVIESLRAKGLIDDIDSNFLEKFGILE